VDDSYNIYSSPGDSKDAPVLAIDEMTVSFVQKFILWNERTAFGEGPLCPKLSFKPVDEFVCFGHAVMCDECPYLINVCLCPFG
jgi:hypothetical protein